MSLVYIEKIPPLIRSAFEKKVIEVANYLEINPNWLMILMNFETAGQMNPTATNIIGCVGFIQFCSDGLYNGEKSKKILGKWYSLQTIKNSGYVGQMNYVRDFFEPYKDKIETIYDLYVALFYPYALGKPDSFKFGSEISPERVKTVANQNKAISQGKEYITYKEVRAMVDGQMKKANYFITKVDSYTSNIKMLKRNKWGIILISVGIGIGTYLYLKNK